MVPKRVENTSVELVKDTSQDSGKAESASSWSADWELAPAVELAISAAMESLEFSCTNSTDESSTLLGAT